MKILGIMQNQWFWNPQKVRDDIAALRQQKGNDYAEKYRRKLIEYALFAGCRSGQVLKRTLGKQICEAITWDEASRQISGKAAAVFPADIDHIRALIVEIDPEIIIAFGQVAAAGVRKATTTLPSEATRKRLFAMHPAARDNAAAWNSLIELRREIEYLAPEFS